MNRSVPLVLVVVLLALSGCNGVSLPDGSPTAETMVPPTQTVSTVTTSERVGPEIRIPECPTTAVPRPEPTSSLTPREYPNLSANHSVERLGEWAAEFERAYQHNRLMTGTGHAGAPDQLDITSTVDAINRSGDAIEIDIQVSAAMAYIPDSENGTLVQGVAPYESTYTVYRQHVIREPANGLRTVSIRC